MLLLWACIKRNQRLQDNCGPTNAPQRAPPRAKSAKQQSWCPVQGQGPTREGTPALAQMAADPHPNPSGHFKQVDTRCHSAKGEEGQQGLAQSGQVDLVAPQVTATRTSKFFDPLMGADCGKGCGDNMRGRWLVAWDWDPFNRGISAEPQAARSTREQELRICASGMTADNGRSRPFGQPGLAYPRSAFEAARHRSHPRAFPDLRY